MARSSPIEIVITEAQMPPGMFGPDPLTLDVRCFVVPAPSGIVLVDTGLPGSSDAIGASIERIGAAWSDITDIVLTHAHFDHAGGVADVAQRAPQATLPGSLALALVKSAADQLMDRAPD
jgi:glyoxylase-like metal-dependent hydrolase (beta-lactamase superfamily II)